MEIGILALERVYLILHPIKCRGSGIARAGEELGAVVLLVSLKQAGRPVGLQVQHELLGATTGTAADDGHEGQGDDVRAVRGGDTSVRASGGKVSHAFPCFP